MRKYKLLIFTILVVAMSISSIGILYYGLQYLSARWEYHNLSTQFISRQEQKTSVSSNDTESSEPLTDSDWLDIDYDAFYKKNSDFAGIIYIPAIDLLYPFTRAEDNTKYLKTTFGGYENNSGCLFLDYRNKKNMSSLHSFIYGHNMKDGSMFGSLKKFDYEPELALESPYVYIYVNNICYTYKIYAYYEATENDGTYNMVTKAAAISQYMKHALILSQFPGYTDDETTADQLLTLSTCWGEKNHFFVVQCFLESAEHVRS